MELSDFYESIPIGKEHAISKNELCELFNLDERLVRKAITDLRNYDNGDNYIIISSCRSKGYYRTDNLEEIQQFEKEILNRGKHTFYPLVKIRKVKERIVSNGK